MWLSIRSKIVLFTIVPMALLYSLIFAVHIYETLRVSRNGIEEFMAQQAGHFADLLDNHLRFIESFGDALAHAYDNSDFGSQAFFELGSATLGENTFLHSIVVGSPGDGIIIHERNGKIERWRWPADDTAMPPVNSKGWTLPFNCPETGEKVVGYRIENKPVYLIVPVSSFVEPLLHNNPRNFNFILIDRESRFVYSDMRSTRPDATFRATAERIRSDSLLRLIDTAVKNGSPGVADVVIRDWPAWYFANPVPETDWVLMTYIREIQALGVVRQSVYQSAFFLFLALMLVGLGVLRISAYIAKPLVRLTRAVDKLGEDDWQVSIPTPANDETGLLGRSINAMAERLRERDLALKKLRAGNISRIAEGLRGHYFYYVLNEKGELTYVSPSVSHILGYSPEKFIEVAVKLMAVEGEESRKIQAMIHTILHGGTQSDALQIQLPHFDGSTRTIEVINVPVVEPGGQISGVEGMGHDVTELVNDTRKFRALLESAPDAMVITDTDELITMVNVRTEQMFGYQRSELINKPLAILSRRRQGRLLEGNLDDPAVPERGQAFEAMCRRRDNTLFPAEVTSSPLSTEEGQLVTIAFRDISQRKKNEKALRQARDRARAADIAKSQFMSNMTHELRTPLNGVLGHVQLLLRRPDLDGEDRNSLETIEDCGHHLLTLINEILDIGKIETTSIQLQPIELRNLLEKVVGILNPRAVRKEIQIRLDIDTDLPAMILTDGTRLRQVLTNLLGNALKFTEQGHVELKVVRDGQNIVYIVSDTGIGIPLDQQSRIFTPFHQVQSSGPQGGTGLGLTISQKLVTAMGGTLQLSSKPGCGSCFFFALPLRLAEGPLRERTLVSPNYCLCLPAGVSPRVLVVDDSNVNREILVCLLERVGFETRSVANGKDALSCIQRYNPELVLMDIRMPVMDGMEVVSRLRSCGNTVPVIAVTASVVPERQKYFIEHGFNACISKPFLVDELLQTIEQVLSIKLVAKDSNDSLSGITALNEEQYHRLTPFMKPLEVAAELGDVDKIEEIISNIRKVQEFQQLADQLHDLQDHFAFERIAGLCREVLLWEQWRS